MKDKFKKSLSITITSLSLTSMLAFCGIKNKSYACASKKTYPGRLHCATNKVDKPNYRTGEVNEESLEVEY